MSEPPAPGHFTQKIYWLNKLSGGLPETGFAPARASAAAGGPRRAPGRVAFEVPAELSEKLFKLTRHSELSLYVFLLSVLKVMLYKYTGADDIVVGSPVLASAPGGEASGKVLPLRTRIAAGASFKDALMRVRETAAGSYANQECPLDELFPLLKIPAGGGAYPPPVTAVLEGIHGREAAGDDGSGVTFHFSKGATNVGGVLSYDPRLFGGEFAERLASHFLNVAARAAADPDAEVSRLVMLGEAEVTRLLEEFAGESRDYPVHRTVNELFERQAEASPERVAGVCAGASLTYRELNERANRLARLLRGVGVAEGSFVPILAERNLNFLTSVLAVLKAGGAYVPVEPTYPPERIRLMLSDSEAATLLITSPLLDTHAPALADCERLRHLVVIDAGAAGTLPAGAEGGRARVYVAGDFETLAAGNLGLANGPQEPAYMIYTSGSTGVPKGAVIRHDGAVNHIYAEAEALGLTSGIVFLQSAPASSDISVWQFLAPVLLGGRAVIVDQGTVSDPEALFDVLKGERVTLAELVPAVLRALIGHASQLAEADRALPDLDWMMATGEAVSAGLVNDWLELYPRIPAVNCYGPSEASDDVTQFVAREPLPSGGGTAPIGRPLANIDIFVLDRDHQLVPVGVPGEICVSGVAVGDGYWKNEEKTRRSFIPNPFAGTKGGVIYKTGDLGRWLPDGNLEFIGRIDHQLKIRGFRVEAGEIEAALARHAGVREAVVLALEGDSGGERRLAAYWVAAAEPAPAAAELRTFLREKLPEHMIPPVFMRLDSMPLLPGGKVDRRALPAPTEQPETAGDPSDAPRTQVGEILAGVWSKVLRLERVASADNFFELGGHSLLGTQVVSQVRSIFQIELPLRSLFEHPTLAGLAACVESYLGAGGGLRVPPLTPAPRGGVLPLSFAQQRLWFFDKLQPASALYNIPAAVRLEGPLGVAALRQSLDEVVRRHEVLRTTFPEVDGRAAQRIAPPSPLALEIVDLRTSAAADVEAEVERLMGAEAERPFDLSRGPLLRAKLLRLGEEDHALLLSMHHIVSDGWSMAVLIRELTTLYEAFSAGRASPLPDLPIQYADFSVWQRGWLTGELLEAQLSYWRAQLGGAPPVLKLPADFPRPAKPSHRGATRSAVLGAHLQGALHEFSRRHGVTLFMTLLAAYQTLLARYSGQEDIVVGADVANRNRAETEGLIGFFVNMLVMRTSLGGDPTVRELLARVRQVSLGAYANQDVPFDKLVEELQPERTLSRNPLFQSVIVLQNMPEEELKVSGLTLRPLEVSNRTAKFDLILTVDEGAEGLRVSVEYSTDVFAAATVERMLGHYENVLTSFTGDPDRRLSQLRILGPAEAGGLTPEDFPDAGLSQRELENILMEINKFSDAG